MAIFRIPWAKPDVEVRALIPGIRDTANMTNAGAITITPVAGRTYDFDAPWGSVATSWEFGDNTSATTSSDKTRHTYAAAGTFAVTATTGSKVATGSVSPAEDPDTMSVPTDAWLKADIIDWLLDHGADITESAASHLTKAELLALVADLTDTEE